MASLCERYRELGVEGLQINPIANDRETVERFVDDVMPQFELEEGDTAQVLEKA